ncbi:MAG: ethanolamine ammonia-lyase subunit EutC [Gammaproteobacteria bacterium]|nr:ethanolamine ammonia-lyase subunit EutC [Gammaproteobacteria bacterium]
MSKSLKQLQLWTKARVVLGHSGNSIRTQEILKFNYACSRARDAVHAVWNVNSTRMDLEAMGEQVIVVTSHVLSRTDYLKQPALGGRLSEESRVVLEKINKDYDVVFIVSDGLSAIAVEKHFLPLWSKIKERLLQTNLRLSPVVLAPFSRVALSDDVGFYLKAKVSVIIIGERPGLTASDSLGIYLTYGPKPGNLDCARNCISNIRTPDGLSSKLGAEKLNFLLTESLKREISGIALKEETIETLFISHNLPSK